MNRDSQVRFLLARDLPLQSVGPQLRASVRRALAVGDPAQLRSVAGAVVAELLRQGVLQRVFIQGQADGALCLKKGTRELVDLSVLAQGQDPPWLPPRDAAPPASAQVGARGPLQTVAGMLGAMEQAQDLQIGGVQTGETAQILENILELLEGIAPQFKLSLMLSSGEGGAAEAGRVFRRDPNDPGAAWVALREHGHAVWVPSARELPRLVAQRADSADAVAVAVPLWEPPAVEASDQPAQEAGLLFVVGDRQWGRDALLKLAGRLSAFVTSRWRHQRDVNQRIHKDALTGVANRAFFDSQFTLELERARRSDRPLTLVIADLDHFKAINDRCGHQAGDQVLKMVARRLQEELRRIDHICRIGGEEFALVLPATSQAAGQEVIARLLRADLAEEVRCEGRSTLLKVTFSYGGVTFPDAGTDAFELYRKADAMLYLSKDLGRNRCHFWSSEGQHVQLLPADS